MVRHEKKKLAVAVDLFLHVFNGLDDGLNGGVVMVVTSQLKAGLRPTSYNYIFVLAPNPSVRRRCLQRLLQNSFIHFAECIGSQRLTQFRQLRAAIFVMTTFPTELTRRCSGGTSSPLFATNIDAKTTRIFGS